MVTHQSDGAGMHFSAENKFLLLDLSPNKLIHILYRLKQFPIKFIGRFLAKKTE